MAQAILFQAADSIPLGMGVTLCICPPGPAREVSPMRSRSIWRAACLPSEIAVTIKD